VAEVIQWDAENKQLLVSSTSGAEPAVIRLHEDGERDELEGETEVGSLRNVVLADLHAIFEEVASSLASVPDISLLVWSEQHSDAPGLHTLTLRPQWGTTLDIFVENPVFTEISDAADIIRPMLSEHGCVVVEETEVDGPPVWGFSFIIRPSDTLRIGELISIARAVDALLERPTARYGTPVGALSLIRTGAVQALVGQPESQWLEAKRKGYGLQSDGQKHELALDVAALGNTNSGGLILIGLSTQKNAAGQDIIVGAPGCSPGSLLPEPYAEAIKHRVVPSIEGLAIDVVELAGRNYLYILVPPQSSYVQPFLVRGGLLEGGKVGGAAFTIPHRVGSSKWSMSAEAVHSLLVAGRAALSRNA
jgi:hypothetical protein